ncbi:MAG: hypothetical protein WAT19_04360 [Ferruginibacter sp.]
MKNKWLKLAMIMQFITAAAHSLSFFVKNEPKNDTEKQLYDLISNYKMDAGAGFHPSFLDLFNTVSSSLTLLCLGAGLINLFLLRSRAQARTIKGIQGIFAIIFGISFIVNLFLSFLPPIICLGLIFLFELVAWWKMKAE